MLNRHLIGLFSSLLLLGACSFEDASPPSLAISSPSNGASVSGTVAVQVSAKDDSGLSQIDLYIKGKDSSEKGVFVGSAVTEPYVISWNTLAQPNQTELALVAVGRDTAGNESSSLPILVKSQNSGMPNLSSLVAFTLAENSSAVKALALTQPVVQASEVVPPKDLTLKEMARARAMLQAFALSSQQTTSLEYILEWQWEALSLADGYGVYLSSADIAGPYEVQVKQAAALGSGLQKHSRALDSAKVGDEFFGAVTAIGNGATSESGFSNADGASFLPEQTSLSPADGAQLAVGRPSLTWSQTTGAVGYLYYLYDKHPLAEGATLLWSNFPQSTEELSASYPADRSVLASGSYWWWVAGVSFDVAGKADGFSFSEAKRFVVP